MGEMVKLTGLWKQKDKSGQIGKNPADYIAWPF